jgi:hypothetical protein
MPSIHYFQNGQPILPPASWGHPDLARYCLDDDGTVLEQRHCANLAGGDGPAWSNAAQHNQHTLPYNVRAILFPHEHAGSSPGTTN